MKVGEVCFLTSDVIRLSNFYKMLFQIDNGSDDNVHQFIISDETNIINISELGSELKLTIFTWSGNINMLYN